LRDRLIETFDNRDHGDDRRDADDNSNQGQRGAKFVLTQAGESDEERFPDRG